MIVQFIIFSSILIDLFSTSLLFNYSCFCDDDVIALVLNIKVHDIQVPLKFSNEWVLFTVICLPQVCTSISKYSDSDNL